ncbi:hypothetical protein SDC9_207458 [bioreactor metagenome]|uniref:Uncharacterized protein n=1 Tax=bioreactor metagenome TaxID=1076179 RepID=A0A645J8I0_9ZZZZ
MAVFPGLGLRPLQRQHHIPQGHQPRARVGVLRAGQLPGRKLKHGEGKYVRGPVHPPLVKVNLPDAGVVGEQNADFTGNRNPLGLQRGLNHPGKEGLRLLRRLNLGLQNHGVLHFCGFLRFSSSS